MLKLLLHVPESTRFEAALKQARNFAVALGDKPYQVRLLVNFAGVKVAEEFAKYETIYKEARSFGVEVYFCENALKGFSVPKERLPEGAEVVPAGIVALVAWQEEGFKYVRA